MNRNLYFVPILAEALRGSDQCESLEKAFMAIETIAQNPDYTVGYRNFIWFMAEVCDHRQRLDDHDLRMVMTEWATGGSDEAECCDSLLSRLLERCPWLRGEYEALCQACGHRALSLRLQILRDGRQIGEVNSGAVPSSHMVDDIYPGHYALRLDTGLVVWEGRLDARNLIWSQAYGGRSLELAAEAGDSRRQPTYEVVVSGAGVVLRTFAGLESGSLEIELKR